jgi:MinD-like ATPase involved in chromosome partitioning or flagellar assembly
MESSRPTCVALLASGARWEPTALTVLGATPRVTVFKRCVDIDDLLASAATGQIDVAVLSAAAPGLDATVVDRLRGFEVRLLAVTDAERATGDVRSGIHQIGINAIVEESNIADLGVRVTTAAIAKEADVTMASRSEPGSTRAFAVWGPAGAPGRTTVAVSIAAEIGRRARPCVLVDADPYGGVVAQQLGVLDEVSGLLAASRMTAGGGLTGDLISARRAVGDRLTVITGLPRADRWAEVRVGTVEKLIDAGRACGDVVVDTGFSLEADPAAELTGRPGRNTLTLEALSAVDDVIVVGTADPVGLARLARALVEIRETHDDRPVWVVVNRQRASLSWSEGEVAAMVEGFARIRGVRFLPEDRSAVDQAMMAGRSVMEGDDSALSRAVAALVETILPGTPVARGRPWPWAGRARKPRRAATRTG